MSWLFLPLVFVPLCPFTVGPSLRIRLLGGRTLERRKWCWSWAAGGEPRPAGFGCAPDGFGDEPEASAAHGLGASSASLFVLGCSLGVRSALSSSSQPSSFRMGLFEPSTPELACWPTVILAKYTKQKNLRRFALYGRFAFNQNRGINLERGDVLLNSTWPPLFVSNPPLTVPTIRVEKLHFIHFQFWPNDTILS